MVNFFNGLNIRKITPSYDTLTCGSISIFEEMLEGVDLGSNINYLGTKKLNIPLDKIKATVTKMTSYTTTNL